MFQRRFRRGIAAVEALGWGTKVGNSALHITGHTAGSVAERANDINHLIADDDVKLIIATVGGHNTNQLLDSIDFSLLAQRPKILLGYSDVSALLVAAYVKSKVVTFLGPALLPQFGEFGGLAEYTRNNLIRMVSTARAAGIILPSYKAITEFLSWDRDDDRPRVCESAPGPWTLQSGLATGRSIASNMGTLLALVGTPWWPDLSGCVLFLEDDEVETPATIEQMLTHLRQIGVFESLNGLVFGRFHPTVGLTNKDDLAALLVRNIGRPNLPTVADFDFGHTDPMLTLPNGLTVTLTADDEATLEILEAAVL